MATPSEGKMEKVADLEGYGLEIWRAHVDAIREQDKNARVMDERKFNTLVRNIKKDKRLESLPFCVFRNDRLELISGHHRIRAARMGGVSEVYILVEKKEIPRSKVVAKQLAHNHIDGYDDPQTLKELFAEILDVEDIMETGIDPKMEGWENLPNLDVDNINLQYDFKLVSFVFLGKAFKQLKELSDLLQKQDMVGLIDKELHEKFAKAIQEMSASQDIRALSAVVAKMIEATKWYVDQEEGNATKSVSGI